MEFRDPIESCPYNAVHRVRRSRMQFHVSTCAQNHSHAGMLQCPFDARHVIERTEFEHHKNTCPARASVIDYAIHDEKLHAKLKILPVDVNPVSMWDEKWDNDPDVKTYDPIKNIQNKPVVYALIGVSKAKRKNHRLQERLRYQRLKENEGKSISQNNSYSKSMPTSSKVNTSMTVVHEIDDDTDEEYTPLRPPMNCPVAHATDKTFDEVAKQSYELSVCKNPEILLSSKFHQSSNDLSNSVAALSINQKMSLSKKSSEHSCTFEKSPRMVDVFSVNKNNQEIRSIPDTGSNVCSNDDYQFNQNQYKDQEKFSIPNTDSIVSSKDDYQFDQCKDQEKLSVSDTIGLLSSIDKYEFCQCQSDKDQEKLSIPDSISLLSSKDKYEFYQYQSDMNFKSSEMSLSIQETSEFDTVFSCIEDDSVIQILSNNIEAVSENDKNKNEIYNVYSENESQHNTTLMHGNSDMSLLSSEIDETLSDSPSHGAIRSRKHSINSTEKNSITNALIFEKLSKTLEEIAIIDEDHKKKNESLNEQIDVLKKKSGKISTSVDLNKSRLSRCAANFLNLNNQK